MEENLKTKLNKGKDEVCSSVTSVARVARIKETKPCGREQRDRQVREVWLT